MAEMRARLAAGLLASVATSGYAAVTIADVVREARVSKRTFYEHFADKDACFVAAYELASERILRAIASAMDASRPWGEQVTSALEAYVGAMEASPRITRTFMLEIHAAGPAALEARARIHRRFSRMLRDVVTVARRKHPELSPLSPAMATALVGGINEMMLVALEDPKAIRIRDVVQTASALVQAMLGARRRNENPPPRAGGGGKRATKQRR